MNNTDKKIPTISSLRELPETSNVISLLNEIFIRDRFFSEHTKLIINGYDISEIYSIISKESR